MDTKSLPHWGERTFVMGVINLTPDSFSGDGLLASPGELTGQALDTALAQAQRFVTHGADILDIGGESTRPGAEAVSAEEEYQRVIPLIKALVSSKIGAIISIDTSKAAVARAALDTGADWVNDVRALRGDEKMAEVVSQFGAPVVLMHNRLRSPGTELHAQLGGRYIGVHYKNLLEDVKSELLESLNIAHKAGIKDDHIILDPGLGFGKTVEQSLELIDRLSELKSLGYPLLVGPSRKSFIGYTLDLPPDERVEGTAAAVAISIARGADIVRVHDVAAITRVARMTDAIIRRH